MRFAFKHLIRKKKYLRLNNELFTWKQVSILYQNVI